MGCLCGADARPVRPDPPRGLRTDFEPIGLRVEQLTSAVEVDAFEEELLAETHQPFNILVATPEKLSLVIRNKKVEERPLALLVMDEAHNLETEGRGLRIELLLATVKMDCPLANFLLLMPYVEGAESVARWLAQDVSAGRAISLGTVPWKPNERIIGLYGAVPDDSQRAGWHLRFKTLTATRKAMALSGTHRVGAVRPVNVPRSQVVTKDGQKGLGLQTAAMAAAMSARGTSYRHRKQHSHCVEYGGKGRAKPAVSRPRAVTYPACSGLSAHRGRLDLPACRRPWRRGSASITPACPTMREP